jgi:RNA polymerase sigma-70 factor (ECF subfamily)
MGADAPPVEPDFDAVLVAARAGDEWAVGVLYRDLHPRLARYLRVRAAHVAEDLEAEVWLAIAERLHRFEGDDVAFRAWAFSIARRRLADHRRQAARRRTDAAPVGVIDRASVLADPERIVLDELAGDEAAAFVMRTLPADQAEVVLLRVVAGLEVEQVAALLGKRPGTIRVMQHRGLRRLERVLAGKRVTR